MNLPFGGLPQSYNCPLCPKRCSSSGGLTRHYNIRHRQFTPASEDEDEHRHHTDLHPKLTGAINTALDLWAAQVLKYGGDTPWKNAGQLYATITLFSTGCPWKVHKFVIKGHTPGTPPKWMTRHTSFAPEWKAGLVQLMSGEWAWKQADTIAQDPSATAPCFDKTTVSVGTGHQEYHLVYSSPGNLTGIARRAHGTVYYRSHFSPYPKSGMTTAEVVRCPDGHFRRAIYEQVWLACVVQGWYAMLPQRSRRPWCSHARHRKTDFLITCFDPGTLWDDFGIRHDIVPFTHDFPRAEIYELLSPDLLHQIIKGTFKDHLVEWVMQYLHETYGEARALEIIADIDHRISAVPSFPGLRRFPDGRDFHQWTGDDSKALMKVYLSAIAGHVPSEMVQCISAFLDFCYLARRNALTSDTLDELDVALDRFHTLRDVFIATGVRVSISLPRQHSMVHYRPSIILFGSPNGLCSSITESKHIKAVKEPWRRSSRYKALIQMLRTLTRLDRLASLRSIFSGQGMLQGSTASYALRMLRGELPEPPAPPEDDEEDDDGGDSPGPKSMSSIELARTPARSFPKDVTQLAAHIHQPRLLELIRRFLFDQINPNSPIPSSQIPLDSCPSFNGRIDSFLSAVTRFYAPSDLCGAGGMYRERIRANPNWHQQYPRYDTVFVVTDSDLQGMQGMVVGRVLLFFSVTHRDSYYPCALVHWIVHLAVIHLDCIARGAHLLPVHGSAFLPHDFHFSYSLDAFRSFFVNRFVDHHTHEFLHEL
ncbi:hypothetical protein B0H13DRAFT_2554444 [Mycena leptocephala]|nr:hypothetical protein B0H13DRAFT_2554444 [Mycena leptocephala]